MKPLWLGISILFSVQVYGQIIRHEFADTYNLNIGELACGKTTEDGSDEVYMIILFQFNSGESGFSVAPVEHWSMYKDQIIIPGDVFTFTLRQNNSIDMLCILMEEDDFPLRDALADELLLRTKAQEHKLTDISYDEIQFAYQFRQFPSFDWPLVTNNDDYLGAFVLHVEPGGFISSFQNINRPYGTIYFSIEEPKPYPIYMDGDGSFYYGYINIK